MEIRDVLHGSIEVESTELSIIDSRFFQRLRQIKQMGFAELSYPSASHNRYIHSLGALSTADKAFQAIFNHSPSSPFSHDRKKSTYTRFRSVLRLAALLHDVGHGPLSHTTEFAMPEVSDLKLPTKKTGRTKVRKATHEDYTLKIILDSDLTPLLEAAGKPYGFNAEHVASLIDPSLDTEDDFFRESIGGETLDFRPLLRQLISSEIDADRMDYLRRDSLNAGVSYGHFDFDWLVSNLTFHIYKGKCFLGLQNRALYAFEDFLISRFHMFLMVYFHYKSVVYDEMLRQYFLSPDCDYVLPAQMDAYSKCTDAELFAHLSKSSNPWARRITEKKPYRMLIELQSGIPATKTALTEQERLLNRIQKNLDNQDIHYLIATSTGELSKYFRKPGDPIFVHYDNHYSAPSYIPLEQCTDLFERYREKRSITRLYVSPENYPKCKHQGRGSPLPYEEKQQRSIST